MSTKQGDNAGKSQSGSAVQKQASRTGRLNAIAREVEALSFGQLLQQKRVAEHLTLRQLESESGVPNSHISAMENGNKRCGARAAKKLADALWPQLRYDDLHDVGQVRSADVVLHNLRKERAAFLYAASSTIKARGVIQDAQLFPPQVLDAVGSKLRAMGIKDRDIVHAALDVTTYHREHYDLVIQLRDNRMFDVNITITERQHG